MNNVLIYAWQWRRNVAIHGFDIDYFRKEVCIMDMIKKVLGYIQGIFAVIASFLTGTLKEEEAGTIVGGIAGTAGGIKDALDD